MELYYRGSCGPRQLVININATDPEAYSVVVFFRLADQSSSNKTEWTAMAMSPQGDGNFTITLTVESDVPLYWSYLQSFLEESNAGYDLPAILNHDAAQDLGRRLCMPVDRC